MSGVEYGDGGRKMGAFVGLADQAGMSWPEFVRAVDGAGVDVAVRAAALRAHHRNKGAYRRNPHGIVTKMEAIRRQVEVMAKCP